MKRHYLRKRYSHLSMEDIIDADYTHAERVRKVNETKQLGKYHDLYIQSNTVILLSNIIAG